MFLVEGAIAFRFGGAIAVPAMNQKENDFSLMPRLTVNEAQIYG